MSENRKLGLIFNWENIAACRALGVDTDADKINRLSAPWDASDQPAITSWTTFKDYAEKQAIIADNIRRAGRSTCIFDYTLYADIKNDDLFGTTQQQNDCTAWAASRCYLAMILHQILKGAEQTVEAVNPMALYAASSGYELQVQQRIPNGGRTIYAIAEASCLSGNFPTASTGQYDGRCVYTQAMANAKKDGQVRQMGWATFDQTNNAGAVVDAVFLACRAGFPVLFGNSTAVQDGYDLDSNGVAVARVNGSGWGGGHAQAWIDYKKVNDTEYVLYANSHGNRYTSNDRQIPGWSIWMTKDRVRRMVSSYFDMMIGTWAESPRCEVVTDLNPPRFEKA